MNKFTLITILILNSLNIINAQIMPTKLNQVELMKQFIGTWKCDFGDNTIFISENTQFGNGMVSNSEIVTNGKTLDTIKQLFGYDNIADKFIIAELKKSSPNIEICSAWFITENTGEIVITNPANSQLKFQFEFKTHDMIVQTAFQNDKVIKVITLNRIK